MKDCCKEKKNLRIIQKEPIIEQCQVCGSKHYRMNAEPGGVQQKMSPLGERHG